jgi:Tfp pilus assembly protein PilO
MDLDDLKMRYKILPFWVRMLCSALLPLLLGTYFYFDEVEPLQVALDEAKVEEDSARTKFEAARSRKDDIPKLKEQLAFTETEFAAAKTLLPDTFQIDDILHKTAALAQQHGVTIQMFEPNEATSAGTQETVRYKELPVTMNALGPFPNVARFYDAILHMDKIVHLRDILIIDRTKPESESPAGQSDAPPPRYVAAVAKLVVFRSFQLHEPDIELGPDGKPLPDSKKDKTKAPPASPTGGQPS